MDNRYTNTAEADVGDLIKGAVHDIETLATQHIKLFKTEMKQEISQLTQGAISLAAGGAILLIGGVMVAITLALALLAMFPNHLPWWGAFGIVAGIICGIGAGALLLGMKRIDDATPLADKTQEEIKEDVQWLKNPK
jgi:F0F1-type ATP synthase assembly protein I